MTDIPRASWIESLKFARTYLIPTALQGPFLRRPRMVGLFAKTRGGELRPGFGADLRAKYGDKGGVYIRFPIQPALLLFDPREIRKVLDDSPFAFAEAAGKRKGMSHFEPEAVTISRGDKFRERRAFNEQVLCPGQLHLFAEGINSIVREEAKSAFDSADVLCWEDFSTLFENITLRVIFGQATRSEQIVRQQLARLMAEANQRRPPSHGELWTRYRSNLLQAIAGSTSESLAGRSREVRPEENFPVEDQITHWLFAMNDTLAENVARVAGIVETLPEIYQQARAEIADKDLDNARVVAGLTYLEACVQETMRLWPTTPFILREVIEEKTLCGATVPAGTQVVIANLIDHLTSGDGPGTENLLVFDPERWSAEPHAFHHFGGGNQRCPGEDLALFIAKGVLATLVAEERYSLLRPKIVAADRLPRSYNPFTIRLERRQP